MSLRKTFYDDLVNFYPQNREIYVAAKSAFASRFLHPVGRPRPRDFANYAGSDGTSRPATLKDVTSMTSFRRLY